MCRGRAPHVHQQQNMNMHHIFSCPHVCNVYMYVCMYAQMYFESRHEHLARTEGLLNGHFRRKREHDVSTLATTPHQVRQTCSFTYTFT